MGLMHVFEDRIQDISLHLARGLEFSLWAVDGPHQRKVRRSRVLQREASLGTFLQTLRGFYIWSVGNPKVYLRGNPKATRSQTLFFHFPAILYWFLQAHIIPWLNDLIIWIIDSSFINSTNKLHPYKVCNSNKLDQFNPIGCLSHHHTCSPKWHSNEVYDIRISSKPSSSWCTFVHQ